MIDSLIFYKMSNINVIGQQAYFNEDAKFFKDVYIYGTLYYEFESKRPLCIAM